MMRSSGYNRFGVLMGTSWPASCPRSHRLQGDFSPMITLILLQRAFCATAIEQLNNALTQIGRPFAFRVDRAIRSYVANYPRWITNWHKCAMADQIEQRIFPKLRGVEPDLAQDALQAIGRVIYQLEDEALRTAFKEGWENES